MWSGRQGGLGVVAYIYRGPRRPVDKPCRRASKSSSYYVAPASVRCDRALTANLPVLSSPARGIQHKKRLYHSVSATSIVFPPSLSSPALSALCSLISSVLMGNVSGQALSDLIASGAQALVRQCSPGCQSSAKAREKRSQVLVSREESDES